MIDRFYRLFFGIGILEGILKKKIDIVNSYIIKTEYEHETIMWPIILYNTLPSYYSYMMRIVTAVIEKVS